MKKIISLVLAAALICLALCACEKAAPDEFVPIDEDTISTAAWLTDSKGEVGTEKGVGIARVFNSLEVTGAVDEKADAVWSFIFISSGQSPTIHRLDYIGENVFNVTVSKDGTDSKFQVTSEELFNVIFSE